MRQGAEDRQGGVREIPATFTPDSVTFNDTLDVTGSYVAYDSAEQDLWTSLTTRYDDLMRAEASYGFDPIGSDEDFAVLQSEIDG
jgi:hypothetical protein